MLKRSRQSIRNKKGFTLVELMVSFTLTAIFMTAAVLVMSSFLKIYYRTNNISQSTSVSDMLLENITSELSLAANVPSDKAIRITKNGHSDSISYWDKDGNAVEMSVDNEGLLLMRYGDASSGVTEWKYEREVYLGNRITKLTFAKEGEKNILDIHMTLQNDKTGYSIESQRVIECFNLNGADIIVG